MGKSWDHGIERIPHQALEDRGPVACEFIVHGPKCPQPAQFRVSYHFLANREGAKPELRQPSFCEIHAHQFCVKNGLCMHCGTKLAKSGQTSSCGPCYLKRSEVARG